MPCKRRVETIGYLASYFGVHDEEQRGVELLFPIVDELLNDPQTENEHKATLYNQKQRILFGLSWEENISECIELLKKSIDLNPDESAFRHNIARMFDYMEQHEQAYEHMIVCLQLDEKKDLFDGDHLETAIMLCKKLGKNEECNRLAKTLFEKSPYKFQLMRLRGMI